MVDSAKGRENQVYLADFISFFVAPKLLNNVVLTEKYLKSGLSASQIAQELGISKQMVLRRLRLQNVTRTQGRGRSEDNYRFPNPPYGRRVVAGRLELNPAEMKVARLIVELRDKKKWEYTQIAVELGIRGLVTRQGSQWARWTVSRVYRLWVGKL